MNRKAFLTSVTLAAPLLGEGFNSLNAQQITDEPLKDKTIDKVLTAMLCMQRAAWEQGTASQALIAIGREDLALLFAKDSVVRQTKEGRLGILGSDAGVTDPGSNGEAVLLAYKKTNDPLYKQAADAQYEYYKHHAPKTSDGILHHVTYAKQVWSDASFMAPPFLALMGDFDEAVKQLEGFRKYLMHPEKKLYYHIWDESKNDYARKLFWGGGNGWTAAGIAKIIGILPQQRQDLRNKLAGYGKEVIDGCIHYQRQDGLFHDIVDDPTSFVETNLAQMLAFSIFSGVKDQWLDKTYLTSAYKMRQAAWKKMDSNGIIQGACGSPNFDKSGTSTEAQSFFLLMESAFQKLPK